MGRTLCFLFNVDFGHVAYCFCVTLPNTLFLTSFYWVVYLFLLLGWNCLRICLSHRFSIPMKKWKWRGLFLSKPNSLISCRQRWTNRRKRKRWVKKVWGMELNDGFVISYVLCIQNILFYLSLCNTNVSSSKYSSHWAQALQGRMSFTWPFWYFVIPTILRLQSSSYTSMRL